MAGSRTLKLSILADVDDLKKKLSTADNDVQGFTGQIEKFGKIAAAAFAAAAAAAAAYAVKIGIDGVKAAIEDEAAQKRLASSLESATGATNDQIKAVEEQITKYQLAYGVSDKDLRPALQRLALSTNDLSKAQDLLSTALDVSAATGKPLESVTNAIAKAYDGSNTSLARLGVGLSAAELKSMSFTQVQEKLNQTFGGAAQEQANTYEGRIARLTQRFEEAKETIGVALLPIIDKLMTFIIYTAIPQFEKFKKNAIDPVIDAISRNKTTFEGLFTFLSEKLAPFLMGGFATSFKVLGTVVSFIVDAVAAGIRALQPILDAAIDGINLVIRGINLIKPGADINSVKKIDLTSSGLPKTSASQFVPSSTATLTLPAVTAPAITTPKISSSVTQSSGVTVPSTPQPIGAVEQPTYNYFNITGAIDPEASARQIIDLLNSSVTRGGGGANTALMA